jgi:hypothetical protein
LSKYEVEFSSCALSTLGAAQPSRLRNLFEIAMRKDWLPSSLLTFALCLAGCGGSSPAPKEAAKPGDAKSVANETVAKESKAQEPTPSTAPAKKETEESTSKGTDDKTSATDVPYKTPVVKKFGLSNLFKAPEIPQEMLIPDKEPEKPAETSQSKSQPRVRLLGFVTIDGERKALVELANNVHSVTIGDVVDGIEVVEIVEDQVTFQFVNARWTTPLFKQEWFNEQSGSSGIAARGTPNGAARGASFNRSFNASSKSTSSKTSKSPFASTRPASSNSTSYGGSNGGQATGGNIPGIPGLSDSGGSGSIPGMPAAGAASSPAGATGSPSGAPGAMPSGAPGAMPGGAPGAMPGGAPGAMPGGAPGAMPGGAPGAMPGGAPGGSPGGLPGGLPTGP